MKFLCDVIVLGYTWGAALPALAVAYVGLLGWPDQVFGPAKYWTSVVIILVGVVIGALRAAYLIKKDVLAQSATATLRVKLILTAEARNPNQIIVVLDKAPWVQLGLVLLLTASIGEAITPICLLYVESFTDAGYPQCAMYTDPDGSNDQLRAYLKDQSRWTTFAGRREVRIAHLENLKS